MKIKEEIAHKHIHKLRIQIASFHCEFLIRTQLIINSNKNKHFHTYKMSNWRDRISFTLTLKHTVYLFYVIKMGPAKLSIMRKEAAGCLSSHGGCENRRKLGAMPWHWRPLWKVPPFLSFQRLIRRVLKIGRKGVENIFLITPIRLEEDEKKVRIKLKRIWRMCKDKERANEADFGGNCA